MITIGDPLHDVPPDRASLHVGNIDLGAVPADSAETVLVPSSPTPATSDGTQLIENGTVLHVHWVAILVAVALVVAIALYAGTSE